MSAAIAIGMLVMSVEAWAQKSGSKGEKLVIFPLQGELPASQAKLPGQLTRTMERAAKKRGMRVSRAEASLADTAMISGCASPDERSCHAQVLEQLGATTGMSGTIAPGETPETLTVTVVYFDGKSQPTRKKFTLSLGEANEELQGMFPALFGEPVAAKYSDNMLGGGGLRLNAMRKRSWYVLGGGGGAMALGVVFWLVANGKQGTINDASVNSLEDLERLVDAERSAKNYAAAGNVLFLSGAIVASVGTYMAIRGMLTARRTGSNARATARRARELRWTPTPLQDGFGVTLRMAW